MVYSPWTDEDLMNLWDMKCDGVHPEDMAEMLDRTVGAVTTKMSDINCNITVRLEDIKKRCEERKIKLELASSENI